MSMTLETIRAAHARIAPYIVQTPLLRLPALDAALGCEVYVKAECMQRTGAFKLRGAMNKILSLTDAERARGFVAASSGNHGRAVAYAAQRFGTHACIVMPETAPAVKQAAIRALGAELVLCDASERFAVAARLCAERGATMVPPFNDEAVMAGQGTVGLEILARCPEIDAVVVPVSGGGSLAACPRRSRRPPPRVFSVRSQLRSRAIRRACAPAVRCGSSKSARSRMRSSRRSRAMSASRTWRQTPTALRTWKMRIFSAV
ncbi:MAG: threonine/serine dehydratase [Oscillospiraceae bacterium]